MKTSSVSLGLLLSISAASITFFSGCVSKTYEKADATALSLQASADLVQETRTQLSSLSDSLVLLRRYEELAMHYDSFTAQADLFQKNAAKLADSALAMQRKGAAYFNQWQNDLEKIKNPALRVSSSARLSEVSSSFAGIKTQYDETSRTLIPFQADIKDIRTALGADLTPAGQATVQPFIQRALVNIEPVKRSLENLATEYSNLGVSLGATPASQP